MSHYGVLRDDVTSPRRPLQPAAATVAYIIFSNFLSVYGLFVANIFVPTTRAAAAKP